MLDAILFDLDGTLLPMDNDEFTKTYFGLLAKSAYAWGYTDSEGLIASIWAGVKSMVKNDGTKSNYEAFWERFQKAIGRDCSKDVPKFDRFYENEFNLARAICGEAPLARAAVEAARRAAKHVILASNPLFPRVATENRMSWVGLSPDDFDWITDYSNSGFCKPNPEYYKDILKRFSLDPSRCLMIGNDVQEDMRAANSCGIDVFIVDDHIINRTGEEISCKHGTYEEMVKFLDSLKNA